VGKRLVKMGMGIEINMHSDHADLRILGSRFECSDRSKTGRMKSAKRMGGLFGTEVVEMTLVRR
jgi:hypothetical protein